MRKIDQDILDEMFPNGYMIFYTNPDGQIRFNILNPHGIEVFNKWASMLMESNQAGDPPSKWTPREEEGFGPIPEAF